MRKLLVLSAVAFLLAGCASLYQSTVTLTSVVDSAMKNWAALSVRGQTSPAIDARVKAAHDIYRNACGVMAQSLQTYKQTGDQSQYIAALQAVKAAASGIIDLIVPLLTESQAQTLKSNLAKAKI